MTTTFIELPLLIEPCHDEASFGNSSPTNLGITNCLLLTSTAGSYEPEYDSYNCERFCHSFPRREKYLRQFLTIGECHGWSL